VQAVFAFSGSLKAESVPINGFAEKHPAAGSLKAPRASAL
jgi:hypothetical protein